MLMKMFTKLLLLILIFNVSAFEFQDIINPNGNCKDTESIKRDKSNSSLEIYGCDNIFPLNPSVHSMKILYLILGENEINELAERDFNELVTVENLEIIKNNVSQMAENVFGSLKRLTQFKIVEPRLRLKNQILCTDCKLQKIHLELHSLDPQMLLKLPKEMRNITIENTSLSRNEFSIPNNLINLKYLRLRNCSMAFWNQSVATFSALEYLDLSHNKLKEIPLISEKYPNLLTMIFSYNRISYIGEKAFESFRSLRELQLDNNDIHIVHQNAFSSNMNLAAVDLSHNSLSIINLNYTNFHSYRVDVKSNRISCDLEDLPAFVNKCNAINSSSRKLSVHSHYFLCIQFALCYIYNTLV